MTPVLREGLPNSVRSYGPMGVLAAVTLVTYANALGLGFVWDDNYQILRNHFLRDPRYIPQIFTSAFWAFLNPNQAQATNFYRPMQSLTYMLCYGLSGLSPWGFHLVSVLLHGAVVLLAYRLLLRLDVAGPVALAAAGLFAVHPVHTESVTWVAGVPDVLCAGFYLLALYLYWGWRSRLSPLSPVSLAGAAVAYFLALLSKEMALTLPVLVLALEWLYRKRPEAARGSAGLQALGSFAAVTGLYIFIRWQVLGFFATTLNAFSLGSFDLLCLRLIFVWDYTHLALVPIPLSAYHSVRLSGLAGDPRVCGGMLVSVAAAWAVWRWRVRAPLYALAVLWFFITLSPVLYLRAVSASLFAERYLYIPSLGACLFLALLLSALCRRATPPSAQRADLVFVRGFAAVVGFVAVLFAALTILRNFDWKDNLTLFSKTMVSSPYAALVHNTLGMEYLRDPRQVDRAHAAFEAALSVPPDYYQPSAEAYTAYIGLGVVQFQKKNYPAARAAFIKAMELNPNREWAYSYLAAVQMQEERNLAGGMALLRKALALNPNNEVTHNLLGLALFNTGQYAAAVTEFQAALQILPTSTESLEYLKLAQGRLAGR